MGLDVSKIEDPAVLRAQREFDVPVYGEPNYGVSRVVLDASGRSHTFDGAVRTESCVGMFGGHAPKGPGLTSSASGRKRNDQEATRRALHATATEIRALSDDLTHITDVVGESSSSAAERRVRPVPRDPLSERLVARMEALAAAQGAVVAESNKCVERRGADPILVKSMRSRRTEGTGKTARSRISSSVQILNFTALFKAVARLDSQLLVNTLNDYVDLVGDLEPESLLPVTDFTSHQINDPLQSLVDFVRDLVSERALTARERQAFVRVLLAAALARGSLNDVLLVVDLLANTVANEDPSGSSWEDESKEAGAVLHDQRADAELYDVVHSLVRLDRYCAKRESAAADKKNDTDVARKSRRTRRDTLARQQRSRTGSSPEAVAPSPVVGGSIQNGFLNADGSLILGTPVGVPYVRLYHEEERSLLPPDFVRADENGRSEDTVDEDVTDGVNDDDAREEDHDIENELTSTSEATEQASSPASVIAVDRVASTEAASAASAASTSVAAAEATSTSPSVASATSTSVAAAGAGAAGASRSSDGSVPVLMSAPTIDWNMSADLAAAPSDRLEYGRLQQSAPLSPSHSPAHSRLLARSVQQHTTLLLEPQSNVSPTAAVSSHPRTTAPSTDTQRTTSAEAKCVESNAEQDTAKKKTPQKPIPFVFTTSDDAISYVKAHIAFPEEYSKISLQSDTDDASVDYSTLPERCSTQIALTYLCACLDRLSRCVRLWEVNDEPWLKCPDGHVLEKFQAQKPGYGCNHNAGSCDGERLPVGTTLYGCRKCNYDACEACFSQAVYSNAALFLKPMSLEVTADALASLMNIIKTSRFVALAINAPLVADSIDKYRTLMHCLLTALRILKVHLNFIATFRLSHSDLNLSQTTLHDFRDVLFSIVRSTAAETREHSVHGFSNDEVNSGIVLVQEGAAQALAEGFHFFYNDVKEQISYLSRWLFSNSKTSEIPSRLEVEVILPKLMEHLATLSGGAQLVRFLKASDGSQDEVVGMFMKLLKACHSEGHTALQDAHKTLGEKGSLPGHPSSGMLNLLKSLQVHLVSYVVDRLSRKPVDDASASSGSASAMPDSTTDEEEKTDEVVVEFLFEYVHELVDLSTQLIETARDLFEPANFTVAIGVLKHSIVNVLALPMVTALCASSLGSVVGSRTSRGYHSLMCKLSSSKSIAKLAALVTSCDDVVQVLASAVRNLERKSIAKKMRVTNSKATHPAKDYKQAVSIRGATHVWVQFIVDECSTDSASVFLQLYRKPSHGIGWVRVGEKFHGSGDGSTFPAEPVRIEGDTVMFRFVSSSAASAKKSEGPKFVAEVSGEVPLAKIPLASCEVATCLEESSRDTSEVAPEFSKKPVSATPDKVSHASVWTLELATASAWLLGGGLSYRMLGGRDEHEEFVTRMWPNLLRGGFETVRRNNDKKQSVVDSADSKDEKDEKDEKDQKTGGDDSEAEQSEVESFATERQFLEDLIRAPLGNDHVQHFIKSLKKHGIRRFIQPTLKPQAELASRAMLAVLIKHTGCVSAARSASVFRSQSLSEAELELVHLWNRSTQVQTTLGSLSQTRQGFSSTQFMAGFLQRAAFALSLSTSKLSNKRWVVDKHMQELRNTLRRAPGLARHRSVASRSRAQRMIEMMRMSFQSLAKMQKALNQSPDDLNNESAIIREVSNFLLCEDLDVDVARVGISLQGNRAKLRIQSLAMAKKLINALHTPALVTGITRQLISAFARQHSGSSVSQQVERSAEDSMVVLDTAHYLSRLNSAGDQLRDDVSRAFFDVIGVLLKRRGLDEEMTILLFKVCSLALESNDLENLYGLGIVDLLESHLSVDVTAQDKQVLTQKQWSSRFSAWTLFRLLAYSLAFYSQTSPQSVVPKLATLREDVFRVIFAQISNLVKLRETLPEERVPDEAESSDWHASATVPAKAKKKKQVKRPPQRSWPCVACTYVNNGGDESCSICETPHETWKCAVCGYLNEMSADDCECGEEKGASPMTEVEQQPTQVNHRDFEDPASEYAALMRSAHLAESPSLFYSRMLANIGVERPMLLNKEGIICRSQVDSMVNEMLWIIARTASVPAIADMFSSNSEVLRMLIQLSDKHRFSRPGALLKEEIAKLVLPRLSPQDVGFLTRGATTPESLVRDACSEIGAAVLSPSHTSYAELLATYDRDSVASGTLRLVKTLLRADEWKSVVNTEIERCLDDLSSDSVVRACKTDDVLTSSESEALCRGCGALASIGGYIPPVVEGARVLVRSDESPDPLGGVVVKFLPGTAGPSRGGAPPWKYVLCDAFDKNQNWDVGMIVDYKDYRYLITYIGWGTRWDEWMPVNSPRIRPVHTETKYVDDPYTELDRGKNSWLNKYHEENGTGGAQSADATATTAAGLSFAVGVVTVQLDSGGLEVVSPGEIERLFLPHEVPLDSIEDPKKIMRSILSFMAKIRCDDSGSGLPSVRSLEFTRRCCYALDAMLQRPEFVTQFAELEDRHVLSEIALQPIKGPTAIRDVFQLECRIREQRFYRDATSESNTESTDETAADESKRENEEASREDGDEAAVIEDPFFVKLDSSSSGIKLLYPSAAFLLNSEEASCAVASSISDEDGIEKLVDFSNSSTSTAWIERREPHAAALDFRVKLSLAYSAQKSVGSDDGGADVAAIDLKDSSDTAVDNDEDATTLPVTNAEIVPGHLSKGSYIHVPLRDNQSWSKSRVVTLLLDVKSAGPITSHSFLTLRNKDKRVLLRELSGKDADPLGSIPAAESAKDDDDDSARHDGEFSKDDRTALFADIKKLHRESMIGLAAFYRELVGEKSISFDLGTLANESCHSVRQFVNKCLSRQAQLDAQAWNGFRITISADGTIADELEDNASVDGHSKYESLAAPEFDEICLGGEEELVFRNIAVFCSPHPGVPAQCIENKWPSHFLQLHNFRSSLEVSDSLVKFAKGGDEAPAKPACIKLEPIQTVADSSDLGGDETTVEYDERKETAADEEGVSVSGGKQLVVSRSTKEPLSSFRLLLDVCVSELPEEEQAVLSCSPEKVMVSVSKLDSHLMLLGTDSDFKVESNKWYRLGLDVAAGEAESESIEIQTAKLFVNDELVSTNIRAGIRFVLERDFLVGDAEASNVMQVKNVIVSSSMSESPLWSSVRKSHERSLTDCQVEWFANQTGKPEWFMHAYEAVARRTKSDDASSNSPFSRASLSETLREASNSVVTQVAELQKTDREKAYRKHAQAISALVGWSEDSVLKSMLKHYTAGNTPPATSSYSSIASWMREMLTEDTPNDTASNSEDLKLDVSGDKDRNLALILDARLNEVPYGLLEPLEKRDEEAKPERIDVTLSESAYAKLPRNKAVTRLMRDTNFQLAVLTSRRALLKSLPIVDFKLLETPQISEFSCLVAHSKQHLTDPVLRVSSAPESVIAAGSDCHPMTILGGAISRTIAREAEHLGETLSAEMKDGFGAERPLKCSASFERCAPLTNSLIEYSMKQLLLQCYRDTPESSSDRDDGDPPTSGVLSDDWVLHLILDYVTSFGSPLADLLDVSRFKKPPTVPLVTRKLSARSQPLEPIAEDRSTPPHSALSPAIAIASALSPKSHAASSSSRSPWKSNRRDTSSPLVTQEHLKHKRVGAHFLAVHAFTPAMINLMLEVLAKGTSRLKRARLLARVFRLSRDFQFSRAKLEYVKALWSSVALPAREATPKAPKLAMDGDWSDRDFQAVAYLQLVLEEQGYIEASTEVLDVQLKEWEFSQGKTCNGSDVVDVDRSVTTISDLKEKCSDMEACAFFTMLGKPVKCPNDHLLEPFTIPRYGFYCDICEDYISEGDDAFSCRGCNYDICEECKNKQRVSYGMLLEKPDPSTIVDLPDADDEQGLWLLTERTVKSLDWSQDLHTVSALLRSLSASRHRRLPDAFARELWTTARGWEAFKDAPKSIDEFHRLSSVFTRSFDRKIIELMNKRIEKLRDQNGSDSDNESDDESDPLQKLRPEAIDFSDDPAFAQMSHISKSHQQLRVLTLLRFNELVRSLLPVLDIGVEPRLSSVAAGLSQCRALLLTAVKNKHFAFVVEKTDWDPSPTMVTLDRISTKRSKDRGKLALSDTNFISLYNQMKGDVSKKKNFLVSPHRQGWKVAFTDEGGEDAGGLYRDSVELICEELQSKWVPLFVPCPNKRDNVGLNRDKWIPNTVDVQRKHAKLYHFVGQLMGLAMRSRHAFPLDLPSIVWKSLVGAPIMRHDVAMVDYYAFKLIENIERSMVNMTADQILDDVLGDTVFTTTDSSKQLRELCANGLERRVTADNLDEFCNAFVQFRLTEFEIATKAMREGLASVVPLAALSLVTWQELELQVCGSKALNVDLLEKMTTYRGEISAEDAHIKMFWRVVRERLDTEQQSKLLQFIWGRSRMPVREEDFESNFRIAPCPDAENGGANVSDYLPIAHTCYFELELPKYDSMDAMYSKLMFAAEHCATIDGDRRVTEVAALLDDPREVHGEDDDEDGFLNATLLSDDESAGADSGDANGALPLGPLLTLTRELSDVYVENLSVYESMMAPPPPPPPHGSVSVGSMSLGSVSVGSVSGISMSASSRAAASVSPDAPEEKSPSGPQSEAGDASEATGANSGERTIRSIALEFYAQLDRENL